MWYKIHNDVVDFTYNCNYLKTLAAAEVTVKTIMDNYPKPYRIMVSGGVDSQAMLYAWKLFGKDYIPTCIVYNYRLNEDDFFVLDEFSKKQDVSIEYIDFDLLKFYKSRFYELIEKYESISPHFISHLGMTENLSGTIIYSGDRLNSNAGNISKANLCLYKASLERPIIPYFFLHTPELAYSEMYENIIEGNFIASDYEKKVSAYQNSGFPIIKQLKKYTGFERVKDYFENHLSHLVNPRLKLVYGNKKKSSLKVYDLVLRYPYEDQYGVEKFKYILNDLTKIQINTQ